MTPQLSPHAQALFQDILFTIADARCEEDAVGWHDKIMEAIATLGDFPESCPPVPPECFDVVPPDADHLHQLIVRPYRIVYEVAGEAVRILSIRHSRMLMTIGDTAWH